MTRTLVRAAEIAGQEKSFSHPWNPKSEVHGLQLGKLCGLARTGVNFVRIPPGKESFVYHSHHYEEEWIYILRGRGLAEIDDAEHEVGPGDFMAFATPSVAHHLKNPFQEELVYLVGGEAREFEVADFPKLGRRMLRRGQTIEIYPNDAGKPFP